MREVSYEDAAGRRFLAALPDGFSDIDAALGILIGPPPLASLNLPLEIEVRLNNELFARGIFSFAKAKANRQDLFGAWQAALRVDCDRVLMVYLESETANTDNQNGYAPAGAVQEVTNGRSSKDSLLAPVDDRGPGEPSERAAAPRRRPRARA